MGSCSGRASRGPHLEQPERFIELVEASSRHTLTASWPAAHAPGGCCLPGGASVRSPAAETHASDDGRASAGARPELSPLLHP